MHHDPPDIHLERCQPALNMARFYQLSVETSLFGEPVLTRRWGRIGTRGRVVCEAFASREGALAALHDHETRKLRRGYRRRP